MSTQCCCMAVEETYPFPIAVLVLLPCFVEVLRVEANDCEGEDHLQKAENEVDDVCNREARTAMISDAHLDLRGCFAEVVLGYRIVELDR
jgi:hypothetical protein